MRNFYPFEMEKMRQRAYGHLSPRAWDFTPSEDAKKSPRKRPPSLTSPNKRKRLSSYSHGGEAFSESDEYEPEPDPITPKKPERRVGRHTRHPAPQDKVDRAPSAFESCTPSKKQRTNKATPHLKEGASTISPAKSTNSASLGSPSTSPSKGDPKHRISPSKRRRITSLLVPDEFASFTDGLDDLSSVAEDPFLRAMHVLHVASRPDVLPCRDEEYTEILSKVLTLLEEGAGGCICKLLTWHDSN